MERTSTEGQFSITFSLIKGYRYRFAFLERPKDTAVVDKTQPYNYCQRLLPFGLTETNFIEVEVEENVMTKEFSVDNGVLDEAGPDM